MLREETGCESDRKFSHVENWEEFLTKWKAVDTEEEAIGLLYAGVDVPPFRKSDKIAGYANEGEALRERIAFYISCSRQSNDTVATAAQKIIIRYWLKRLNIFWIGISDGYWEATNMVLEFLQKTSEPMLKTPHPRFVSEYLLPLHKEWRHGRAPDYQRDKTHQTLKNSTKLIVKALCVWGLGYVLAEDGLKPEIIPIIKEFLDERGYQTGNVFMKISGYGEPPSDLSTPVSMEKVEYIAACAFLKLKYWVGGGFTAKFIRTFPTIHSAE